MFSSTSGRSESTVSEDFPPAFLSPSPEDEDDKGLDFDLDAMETPSDCESLPFPMCDLDLEGERSEVSQSGVTDWPDLFLTCLFSRRPAASWCRVPPPQAVRSQAWFRLSDRFCARDRPGQGGHCGQSGNQVALFLHRRPPPGKSGQHERPGAVRQSAVTRRYDLPVR